jgi:hypothetical protein
MTTVTYTYDEDTVSDLHKDAYGFRPSSAWWACWNANSDDLKQEEWDRLVDELGLTNKRQEAYEMEAIARFEKAVDTTVATGAATRKDAVRWMMDGSNVNGDTEYFEYQMGLPYGYIKKTYI